jgi:hypothetical protein
LPFQLQQLLNCQVGLDPLAGDLSTFQDALTETGSPKSSSIVQPLIEVPPLLTTAISTWKLLPQPLVPVTEQVTLPPPLELDELLLDELEELLLEDELLDDELEELEELLEEELELLEPFSSA